MIEAMAQWYQRGDGDQTRLSRILEVAHDLKALSTLLTARPFPFVIDLACIASRREYLKLDKWLSDKIRDHGEIFITALVKFLQVCYPKLQKANFTQVTAWYVEFIAEEVPSACGRR